MGDLLNCNFYFVVHTACYCMDVIRLNGNVWINIPLCLGKMVSGMTVRCECGQRGEVALILKNIYLIYI